MKLMPLNVTCLSVDTTALCHFFGVEQLGEGSADR